MPRTQAAESARDATASLIALLLGGTFAVWSAWVTIIAFTGGAAPLVTFDGPDIGRGLMVMIIGFPIVGTIVYWVGMAVTLVTASVVGGLADLVVRD